MVLNAKKFHNIYFGIVSQNDDFIFSSTEYSYHIVVRRKYQVQQLIMDLNLSHIQEIRVNKQKKKQMQLQKCPRNEVAKK